MKLRILPVVLTFLITSGLLFGGWYLYESLAIESPMHARIASIDGIEDFTVETAKDAVNIGILLDDDAELSKVWSTIHEQMQSDLNERKLQIQILNTASDKLDQLWTTALFDVAEAMDAREYSAIPERMNELAAANEGMRVDSAIDDHNIYLTLSLEDSYKYVILPRQSKLGVWTNE